MSVLILIIEAALAVLTIIASLAWLRKSLARLRTLDEEAKARGFGKYLLTPQFDDKGQLAGFEEECSVPSVKRVVREASVPSPAAVRRASCGCLLDPNEIKLTTEQWKDVEAVSKELVGSGAFDEFEASREAISVLGFAKKAER